MDDSSKVENDKEAVTETVVSKPVQERRKLFRRLLALAGLGITGLLLSQDKTGLLPTVTATGNIVADATNTGNTGTTEIDTSVPGAGFIVFNSDDSGGSSGVVGEATGTTKINYGVVGETSSTGNANSFSDPSLGAAGVYGAALSSFAGRFSTGVLGVNIGGASDGFGVAGVNKGTGPGVLGMSQATDFGNSNGVGVQGVAGAPHGIGVKGSCAFPFQVGFPDAVPLVAQGASGQTGNLQEWRNSSGTALSVVGPNGSFGVGTASPLATLHVLNSSALSCNFQAGGGDVNINWFKAAASNFSTFGFFTGSPSTPTRNYYLSHFNDNTLRISRSSTGNDVVLDNSGNVGIGTTAPTQKLHVVGSVRATGGLITGDITFANGVKAAEDGTGLAFKGPDGTKLASLDLQGNLHIKGDIIKDL